MDRDTTDRVLLEVDMFTLRRLLERRAISAEDFRSVDNAGKRQLQSLFLTLLHRELATHSIN